MAGAEVILECPELCPRFTARVFEDVTIAPSPPWLKARLSAAGQRPINNVVDITNYAMLLSGQPLHAFDLDRVAGARLIVRRAHDGEQVQTLDSQTRTLDSEMVVIEDADGPTSIAGLMGGARSEVQPDTTRVLMEVATWNGPNIHRSSLALGLRSEASGRFEKGLQPEQCMHAQAIATLLMIELCGARVVPGTIDLGLQARAGSPRGPPSGCARRACRRSSACPSRASARRRSSRPLDFATQPADDGLDVTVPALRRDDVTREIDLIEEVARIDGVERLPATLPARRGAAGRLTHAQRVRRAAEDAMVGRGLHEIVGWSFTDPAAARPAAASGRARAAERRQRSRTRCRRASRSCAPRCSARCSTPRGTTSRATAPTSRSSSRAPCTARTRTPPPRATPRDFPADEHHGLGVLLSGALAPRSWRGAASRRRLLRRQGAARSAARALPRRVLGAGWRLAVPAPRRSAAVMATPSAGSALADTDGAGAVHLGFIGELHPLVAGAWDLQRTAASRSTSASSPRSPRRWSTSPRSARSRRCARISR